MKQIKKFPNYYITKTGKVWSKPRKNTKGGWMTKHIHGGYHRADLTKDGKTYGRYVHRLVALAHILNPKNKPRVNHLDGNKLNNHVSNLDWATAKEDIRHAIETGLLNNRGENSVKAKLTWDDVREIRKNHYSKNIMKRKPWESYGIKNSQYYVILNNQGWKEEWGALD